MSDAPGQQNPSEEAAEEQLAVDPEKLERVLDDMRAEQNILGGAFAGLSAAAIGGALWAAIQILTGYEVGFVAIAVGLMAGFAVRIGGKGIDRSFGFLGAACGLLGCALGKILGVIGHLSRSSEATFMEILTQLDAEILRGILVDSADLFDVLFYGIAAYEGFRFAFRQVTQQEVLERAEML